MITDRFEKVSDFASHFLFNQGGWVQFIPSKIINSSNRWTFHQQVVLNKIIKYKNLWGDRNEEKVSHYFF